MNTIGNNIRKFRILLDIKQATMAEMLNLSVTSYGKLERNEVNIKPERLNQIVAILGINETYIKDFNQFLSTIRQQKRHNP
jgi:transcriptional regulator with XRE-family HTH domain